MTKSIRIGTRGSKLALAQSNQVKLRLLSIHPGITVDIVPIKTTGDKITDQPLNDIGGKGLFTKEIEEALLENNVDIAVHSLKDMPASQPDGLTIATILERETAFDAFVSNRYDSLQALPQKAKIGTSSLRRQAQLLKLRPDLEITPLRGNIDTRLDKLQDGSMDAIILAGAGLNRLNLSHHIKELFTPEDMLPAASQGAIAIEVCSDNTDILSLLSPLHHEETAICVAAERAFLHALEGNCATPIAAHATIEEDNLSLVGMISSSDATLYFHHQLSAPPKEATSLGLELADAIKKQAGNDFNHIISA